MGEKDANVDRKRNEIIENVRRILLNELGFTACEIDEMLFTAGELSDSDFWDFVFRSEKEIYINVLVN